MDIFSRKRKQADDRESLNEGPDSSSMKLKKKSCAYGLEVLYQPEDESSATYDIVFVHGLGGSIQTTWLHEKSGVHWPKDFIAQDLSNFRVFAFGYDADVVNTWNPASKSRITNHAQDLLGALAGERYLYETNERMIVFVGHSLGGLVIQQALLASKNAVEKYMQKILERTYAIAFLGTPHLGADLARWAAFGSQIMSFFKCSNTGVLDVLQPGSEMLAQIQENFQKMLRLRERDGRPIHITCFYEQLPLRITGDLVVTAQSAVLPAYPSYGIHANHMDMTKFETRADDGYQTVLKSLLIWQKEMSRIGLVSTSRCSLSAKDERLLQKFYTCDYESHKMLLPSAVTGTCEWIQQHQKYIQWKARFGPRLLWMTSDPGCGKSVLVSYLIDQLHSERKAGSNVCYFFFSDSDGERNNSSSMMRCVLHQIFTAQPHLFKHAEAELRSKGSRVTEQFATMWKIFLAAIGNPQCREIYCLIDALDECESNSRQQLIKAFSELFSNEPPSCESPRIRVFVTTRTIEYLKSGPRGPQSVTLGGEEVMESIGNDISLVVRARVNTLTQRRRLSKDVQDRLIQRLQRDADQTFLWVTLVLEMLEDSASASEEALNTIIQDLPSDLDGVYEKLLSQNSDVKIARIILHIIVASFRPFTLKEINIALVIHSDDSAIANVKSKLDPSIDYAIRKICGPIVRISDSKVTLVHSTAKSFLLQKSLHPVSADNSWKRSLSSVDSHTLLVDICTKYLLLEEIKNDRILDTIYPSDVESDDCESQCGSTISDIIRKGDPYNEERLVLIVDSYTKRYEFLDYSAKHWAEHYRLSERNGSLIPRIASLCDAFQRSSYYTWFYIYTTSSPMWRYKYIELSTLMVASYFGLEDLAAKEISSGVRIDEIDECHWTALMYAAWSGSKGIIEMLLKNGARVNAIGDSHTATFQEEHTALMAAAANGHAEIVHLLIDHGAKTKTHTEFALSTAAANGHERVVVTLLGNGCDIEECNYYGQVPLHHACLSGRGDVFKLLISRGANHFTKDRNGRSALDMAAESGSEEIVKWLLAKGADINGTDCYGTTAFDLAHFFGHDRVMRLLLDHGATSPYVGDIGENQIQPKHDEPSYNERLRSLNFKSSTAMEKLRCFPWVLRKALLRPDGKGNFEDNPNWGDELESQIQEVAKKILATTHA